ncbi:MAG: hypothetical protein AVDCRST_MAG06-1577, partial [uncultured Nocardioides sp.]
DERHGLSHHRRPRGRQGAGRLTFRAPGSDDARPAVPHGARVPRARQGDRPVRHLRPRRHRGRGPRRVRGHGGRDAGDPPVPRLHGGPAPGARPHRLRGVRRRRLPHLDRGGRRQGPAEACHGPARLRQAEGPDLRRAARQAARRAPRRLGEGGGRLRRGRSPLGRRRGRRRLTAEGQGLQEGPEGRGEGRRPDGL